MIYLSIKAEKNSNPRVMKRLASCLTKQMRHFCFKKVFPVNPIPFLLRVMEKKKIYRVAPQDVVQSLLKLGMYLHYMKSKPLIRTHDETLLPSCCFSGVTKT